MASPCRKQQCTIDRRGFRLELDSWRHKLIHCVGFESILEGLIGSELIKDLKVFKKSDPVAVSDWSFDENCLFCCLRREKVKEHLCGFNKEHLEDGPKPLLVKDPLRIITLEREAEEFLTAILCTKDVPNFSDPNVPVVAREILQRMISQFAAEYTSKTSSPQDSHSDSPPRSDQSRPAPSVLSGTLKTSPTDFLAVPAQNQNPVLSKLLMDDQDAPLDLTIKRPVAEPNEQDGVLDLSVKKHRYTSSKSAHSLSLSPATSTLKCESPDYRAAKAKDLQSTSTLEQFIAKLCPHHQRRIVDAIGFLQTEVKAHASSNVQKTSDSNSGMRGKASLNANSSSVNLEKSHPEPKLSCESTPKVEVLEFPNSVPNSSAQKIPENAVALKTSSPALNVFSIGFERDKPLTSSTAILVDGDNRRQNDQPPVRMKIKTSNAAAGKKLSCVLDDNLSSPSHTLKEKQGSINRAETQSARLSSSVNRQGQMSVTSQASHKEVLGIQKDKLANVFPVHMSFPSNSVRTARKTVRVSSEHPTRDDGRREIIDPDIGNCDIVFIDKPITECLKEKQRNMAPRRNARKSTRGSMYFDDIWELKTVRTLAGRGNCPNPMPELTIPVTPKQILSKPEGLPPVDMPFAGACTKTMNEQISSQESDERVIPGAGDVVQVAASKVDSVEVEMSQTDQGSNKAQSGPPMNLLTESQEVLANTLADQETIKDLEMAKESEERVYSPPRESTTDIEPQSQQVVPDHTEQAVTETQGEASESLTTQEAEHQVSSDKLSCEDNIQQNSSATEDPLVEEMEKDKKEQMQDEQSQEIQPETELHFDHVGMTEKSVSTTTEEELPVKDRETETPQSNNSIEPLETKNNEAECNEPAKPVDELPKEFPPGRRKKDTKTQAPDLFSQTEPVIVGFVNGKPVSASDRSLRNRADRNATLSSKNPVKSCQDVLNSDVSDSTPSTVGSKKMEKTPPEINKSLTLKLPMIQHLTCRFSDLPTSPTSELTSRTKETPKQKSAQRNQCTISVLSDEPADHTQTPKRQLRSASQKTIASTSSIVTSISSPKPSSLILPPAEQLTSILLPFPIPVTISSLSRHSGPSISECSQQQEVLESVPINPENTQPTKTISEDIHKNKLEREFETKQTLRSGKVVSENSENEKKQLTMEELNSSENPFPENQAESLPIRSKRRLRNDSDAGDAALIKKKNITSVEDRLASGDKDTSMSEKPTKMPLRSESSKAEMSNQSVVQSLPADNKKLALRSQRSTPHSTNVADGPKQNDISSPVRIIPERIPKTQLKPRSGSVTSLTHSSQIAIITPKQEPPKQTVNKFFQALTGEKNQQLITNLNNKYERMLKGWVQMDKEGQPTAKYKNKSDRQAAIWKSKRRARKPKSSEQQKYSPVQMLFMKGFSLTSICRWFLDSTETKSLVIVKKVNTRLPSETQLCFHSSSSMSGPSQGVFPSLQAERLKKHLKKFPIASPVKSNPKSQKLIAKALEQEANTVKPKERAELSGSSQNVSKYSAAKASAQKGESPKPSGKSKNPASARILRKYSNIRGKMQGQQTTVRIKPGSKMLEKKKIKSLASTKSAAKSNLNPSLKVKKSAVHVSKKIKESTAKLTGRKILAGKKSTKPSVQKRAVRAQAGKASKEKTKAELPKRCSQRLGTPKVPENQPAETAKSKVSSKKQNEEEKAECQVNKKTQTKESSQRTVVESKHKEIAAKMPQQDVDVKTSSSPDQIQTRSQKKMEAAIPVSGTPSNPAKRAKKAPQAASPKAASEVDEPKLTRSGALKRTQASSLPRSGTKVATKRAQELPETPAKRTRAK